VANHRYLLAQALLEAGVGHHLPLRVHTCDGDEIAGVVVMVQAQSHHRQLLQEEVVAL
jgi:hypothetical protein